jgi:hypothetical protein
MKIWRNEAILGIKKQEADKKFDESEKYMET